MTVDIIILSHARNQMLLELTQRTINSCHTSESEISFNILVIEQEQGVIYNNCTMHYITEPFNYNRFMNIGISMTSNEYVCLCNNDLEFKKGWCSNMIPIMQKYNLLSACPKCPDSTVGRTLPVDFGYNNKHHMSGWCIMTNRKLYGIIGKINEDFPFWFADNEYAEQLKEFKVRHALISSSVVRHLGSSTLSLLDAVTHNEYTTALIEKFIAKRPNNESSIWFKKQLAK